jgi:thiamine pyrophosphate-dependent acetolactate synthase large subunit-like protein
MEEEIDPYQVEQQYWNPIELGGLSKKQVEFVADLLVQAKEPLVVTGYSGRNHAAVGALVELASTVKGLRVLDTGGSDMCFPADHPAWLGLRYGIDDSIKTADFILCLDVDVPWINTQCKPRKDAKIVHIDVDPLKQQMPVFYIDAIARYKADAETSISQLTEHIKNTKSDTISSQAFSDRWTALQQSHKSRLETIASQAKAADDGTYATSYLMSEVRKAVPKDTLWAIEAVTQTGFVADQVQATIPGSWINCGGGGLGWSGGGALGIKLASDVQAGGTNKGKFVCQVVGDGTFLFSVPGSVYWIAQRYNIPILTIVLNNKGKFLESTRVSPPDYRRIMLTDTLLSRLERAPPLPPPRAPRRRGLARHQRRPQHLVLAHARLPRHRKGRRRPQVLDRRGLDGRRIGEIAAGSGEGGARRAVCGAGGAARRTSGQVWRWESCDCRLSRVIGE